VSTAMSVYFCVCSELSTCNVCILLATLCLLQVVHIFACMCVCLYLQNMHSSVCACLCVGVCVVQGTCNWISRHAFISVMEISASVRK